MGIFFSLKILLFFFNIVFCLKRHDKKELISPKCKIGIHYVGGKNMTTAVWREWKELMSKIRQGPDWWNHRDTELAVGPLFLDALLSSPSFTENIDEADFVFVTRYGGMLYAIRDHPWYAHGASFKRYIALEYQKAFEEFLVSPKYVQQQGFGFVFEAAHVYSPFNHIWMENNLFIATDPAFNVRDGFLVPYATVWPGRWPRQQIDSCEKKFWLSYMGRTSGGQRNRFHQEITSLQDKRIFWNHNNFSRNSADRWKWMCESKFCFDPEGDVKSTLREYEPVLVGCVPVMVTAYEYPFQKILGSYSQWAVVLPSDFSLKQIIQHLETLSDEAYFEKRRKGLEIGANFLYDDRELLDGTLPIGKASENIITEICDRLPKLQGDLRRIRAS